MMDVIATAFQSDTTRIATFMFGNAVSNVSFRFLEGVSAGHHDVSHHQKDADKLRQYELISKWHVEQYAYLLRKLQSMKEGDSNLLDNSMVLFSSALSDGNSHNPHDLPLVLARQGRRPHRYRAESGLRRRQSARKPVCLDVGCIRHTRGEVCRQYR